MPALVVVAGASSDALQTLPATQLLTREKLPDCNPVRSELESAVRRLRSLHKDDNQFLNAFDEATVGRTGLAPEFERLVLANSDDIVIGGAGPYGVFRSNLSEALRKREPLETLQVPVGYGITVMPKRLTSPDIIKIVVERDGTEVPALANLLINDVFRTPLGAQRVLHMGAVIFPCSVFDGTGDVTITIIPESGSNIVKAFAPTAKQAASLIGLDENAVLERIGPPVRTEGARRTYRTSDGRELLVYFADGKVTDVRPREISIDLIRRQ
jgi:hypothetical protein